MKILQICPPHLSDVATLPWEIQKKLFSAFSDRAMLNECFILLLLGRNLIAASSVSGAYGEIKCAKNYNK